MTKIFLGPFRCLEEEINAVRQETGEDDDITIENIMLLEWKNIFSSYEQRLRNAARELIEHERLGHQNEHSSLIEALKETFASLSDCK